MKESEKLMIESNHEENDYKAWALHFKSLRAEKWEYFVENILPEINDSPNIHGCAIRYEHHFKIIFNNGVTVDYYPKKDRILFIKQNKWAYNGLSEIEKML